MSSWTKILPATVLAIVGVLSLILAWAGQLIDVEPGSIRTSINIGIMFLTLAIVFFARGRRLGGGGRTAEYLTCS